jgi:hypothetical protein
MLIIEADPCDIWTSAASRCGAPAGVPGHLFPECDLA